MSSNEKQFLITGVSSGFGRAFAEAALEKGHRVVGTVRNDEAAAKFERLAPGRANAVLDPAEGVVGHVAGLARAGGRVPGDVGDRNALTAGRHDYLTGPPRSRPPTGPPPWPV